VVVLSTLRRAALSIFGVMHGPELSNVFLTCQCFAPLRAKVTAPPYSRDTPARHLQFTTRIIGLGMTELDGRGRIRISGTSLA